MCNSDSATDTLASGATIRLRRLRTDDLPQVAGFPFTASIHKPLDDPAALNAAHTHNGLWDNEAGAAAIVETATDRLIGTTQFYRSAPCIHGLELGYILHDRNDRGRGLGIEALRLITDHLFAAFPTVHRLQLVIAAWNVASWKLAERCSYIREGLLRSAGFGDDPADCLLYARTRRDWAEEQHRPVSLGG